MDVRARKAHLMQTCGAAFRYGDQRRALNTRSLTLTLTRTLTLTLFLTLTLALALTLTLTLSH